MGVTLNLRQAIMEKVSNKPDKDVIDMIEGSIDYDERALPGLGVLFEVIWKESDSELRQQMVDTLQHKLHQDDHPAPDGMQKRGSAGFTETDSCFCAAFWDDASNFLYRGFKNRDFTLTRRQALQYI